MTLERLDQESFEQKKTNFFSALGVELYKALELHKTVGHLWEKEFDTKREWGNVSEHCLVEAARSEILADWLDFSIDNKQNLMIAAVLHDLMKKYEVLGIRDKSKDESALQIMRDNSDNAKQLMRQAGIEEDVIEISSFAGGDPEILLKVKKILDQEDLNDTELAFLIMQYIDGYTINADWVEPLDQITMDNAVDHRRRKNELNRINLEIKDDVAREFEGLEFFGNKTNVQAVSDLGHLIEEKITKIIFNKTGKTIDPLMLPEFIDDEIRKRINNPKK